MIDVLTFIALGGLGLVLLSILSHLYAYIINKIIGGKYEVK